MPRMYIFFLHSFIQIGKKYFPWDITFKKQWKGERWALIHPQVYIVILIKKKQPRLLNRETLSQKAKQTNKQKEQQQQQKKIRFVSDSW